MPRCATIRKERRGWALGPGPPPSFLSPSGQPVWEGTRRGKNRVGGLGSVINWMDFAKPRANHCTTAAPFPALSPWHPNRSWPYGHCQSPSGAPAPKAVEVARSTQMGLFLCGCGRASVLVSGLVSAARHAAGKSSPASIVGPRQISNSQHKTPALWTHEKGEDTLQSVHQPEASRMAGLATMLEGTPNILANLALRNQFQGLVRGQRNSRKPKP